MDKLQADKLTRIKANAELLQEEGYKSGLLDDCLYLLQLVETQAKAIEEAVKIYETADMESDFADVLDGMYERLKEVLTQV